MPEQIASCEKCGCTLPYQSHANFIIICPNCFEEMFLECEYGFGPVVPCVILVGTHPVATVVEDQHYNYFLRWHPCEKPTALKERYYDALLEAARIVQNRLKEASIF